MTETTQHGETQHGASQHGATEPDRAQRTAQRMVEVATELATEGGYDAVQMREVARRVPIALATLYRYYPSKDALLRAVIGAQLTALDDDVRRRPPRHKTAGARAAAVFIRGFHAMVRDQGLAHATMSVFQMPRPLKQPDGTPRPTPEAGTRSHRFADLAARAAWGADHETTPREAEALAIMESLWVGCMVGWLDGQVSGDEVESRLRFAAERLVGD